MMKRRPIFPLTFLAFALLWGCQESTPEPDPEVKELQDQFNRLVEATKKLQWRIRWHNGDSADDNRERYELLQKNLKESGSPAQLARLKDLDSLRARTLSLSEYLSDITKDIYRLADQDVETGIIHSPGYYRDKQMYWMDDQVEVLPHGGYTGKGKALELGLKLEAHHKWLEEHFLFDTTGKKIETRERNLIPEYFTAAMDEYVSENGDKWASWEEYRFSGSPACTDLVWMEDIQSRIWKWERNAQLIVADEFNIHIQYF